MISPNYVSRSGMSSSTVGPASSNRLWVGPLLLILVIALIYIFSLMPNGPTPHRFQSRFPHEEDDEFEFHHRRLEELTRADEDENATKEQLLLSDGICVNGGSYNETSESCICGHNFSGNRCEVVLTKQLCLNNGYFSQKIGRCHCPMPWTGQLCQHRCSGGFGRVNRTTWTCQCGNPQMFGTNCDSVCINGEVVDDICRCLPGYYGRSCATCDPSYMTSGECDVNNKRRGAVNSRLTLSGLSFCMITIGLLCVTARRRRQSMVPPMDDTWYRVFQTQPRHRCRHEFSCGSAWLPRDRALFVTTGRASVSHGGRRGNGSRGTRRMTTPPPSYTSVDNMTDDESPPTYEEALRTLDEERSDMIETPREEEVKDESGGSAENEVVVAAPVTDASEGAPITEESPTSPSQ
ncbi:unnamed protein product [Auanema sp. JU1783]|nr:unnamed protein product [Auanema sp. JU1783]